MDEKKLKEMFDKAESMGFDRGVKTIFIEILKAMEEEGMKVISVDSLKKLYKEYEKQNENK